MQANTGWIDRTDGSSYERENSFTAKVRQASDTWWWEWRVYGHHGELLHGGRRGNRCSAKWHATDYIKKLTQHEKHTAENSSSR